MIVRVTAHAVLRARARRHFALLAGLEVERLIGLEVREAIMAGRVSREKPAWTKLVRRSEVMNGCLSSKPVQCREGTQFVWNHDETLGWIVKREGPVTVVLTSLHRVRSETLAA